MWMHYEVLARWDAASSMFKHYRNSVPDIEEEGFDPAVSGVAEIRIGHYWGMDPANACGPNSGADIYTDVVYVDDTFQRVLIGNAETVGASSRRAVQRATAWSDGSITVVANLAGLSESDAHTLFVIGADDEVLHSEPIVLAWR